MQKRRITIFDTTLRDGEQSPGIVLRPHEKAEIALQLERLRVDVVEAGIHQDGVLKDVATYQIMDPAELGLRMTLPLGKHSGRHAFARACSDAGIELGDEELRDAFARFKALADERKAMTLYDVFEEVHAA